MSNKDRKEGKSLTIKLQTKLKTKRSIFKTKY